MSERTSFFQEAPGVYSMVRLVAFVMTLFVGLFVLTACVVAVRGGEQALQMIGVLTAPLATLCAGIWAALKVRQ